MIRHPTIRSSSILVALVLTATVSLWLGTRSDANTRLSPERSTRAAEGIAQLDESTIAASARTDRLQREPRIVRARPLTIQSTVPSLGIVVAGLVAWRLATTRRRPRFKASHHSIVAPRGPPALSV